MEIEIRWKKCWSSLNPRREAEERRKNVLCSDPQYVAAAALLISSEGIIIGFTKMILGLINWSANKII